MMHSSRRWGLSEVESAEALARMLTKRTWTLCSAFYVKGHPRYLFLNDATHEDGAGEYGVLKKVAGGSFVQIESITFSWCDQPEGRKYIEAALAGQFDESDFIRPVTPRIDQPGQHKDCDLCA